MRAVQFDRYGGGAEGLKHVEVPIPTPKKGEVLIKMEAASVNPADWKIQKGMVRPFLPRKFPSIPGNDPSMHACVLSGGGFAEYAVAQASLTVARPPEVSSAEGACLPLAALTALQSLRAAGVGLDARGGGDPKNVLVTAASGGIGHFAVQLASLAGHRVTATCGARNLGLVGGLGADEVLDYGTPDGAALRSPSGRRYDAVVHCAPHFPWSVFQPVLADGGVVVDITPGAAAVLTALLHRVTFSKKRLTPLMFSPSKDDMELLVDMTRQGMLKPVVDSSYPLSRAAEGWAISMAGHATGKRGGGFAEYAVAQASLTVARPPEVSSAEGACLPLAAVTALQSLRAAGVGLDARGGDPKNILVTTASGGVGHFAVQLASLAGHRVTATCGTRNLGFIGGLGADEVLDYATPDGAALRSPSGKRYDAVVHCAPSFPWSVFDRVLVDAGVVVDITPFPSAITTALLRRVTFSKMKLTPLVFLPSKDDMEVLVDMARQGMLKPVVDSSYPLSRAPEGWAMSMAGHATGKVVIETRQPH
ncbi:hypothetical protein ABZP36_035669 [Zizania latifolia]